MSESGSPVGSRAPSVASTPADKPTPATRGRPRKRRRLSSERDERPRVPVLIRPAPSAAPPPIYQPSPLPSMLTGSALRPKQKAPPSNKRSSALNLRNYPSSQHPAGMAIWVLQKIEQMRRDQLESASPHESTRSWQNQQESYQPSPPNTNGPQRTYEWIQPNLSTTSSQWPNQHTGAGYSPQEEPDNVRLQSQRDRKTKQRSENWAKNKENDVVARAKLEAKKKFDDSHSEIERQAWIEQRIKEDFERLLNRMTTQFSGEVAHLWPFQIGFSEHYFDQRAWNHGSDLQALHAGRLLAAVLPGLAESQVTTRSQSAVAALVKALEEVDPSPEAFFAGIRILSELPDVLLGIDRVLAYLFSPKTGPSLARKKSSDPSHASAGLGLATTPQGPPILHWKEPATPRNATQQSQHPSRFQAASAQTFAGVPDQRQHSYGPAHVPAAYGWPPIDNSAFLGPPPPHYYLLHHSQQYIPEPPKMPYYSPQHAVAASKALKLDSTDQAPPSNSEGHDVPATTSPPRYSIHGGLSPPTTSRARSDSQGSDRSSQLRTPSLPSTGRDEVEPIVPNLEHGVAEHDTASTADEDTIVVAVGAGAGSKLVAPGFGEVDGSSKVSATLPEPSSPLQRARGEIEGDGVVKDDSAHLPQDGKSQEKTPRFSKRERKPTARAISANLTPSLLAKTQLMCGPLKNTSPGHSSLHSVPASPEQTLQDIGDVTVHRVTTITAIHEVDAANGLESAPCTPGATSPEEPTIDVTALGAGVASNRSSRRERKPTAKAIELSMKPIGRKRSASPAMSPPPPKVAKTTRHSKRGASLLRTSATPTPEITVSPKLTVQNPNEETKIVKYLDLNEEVAMSEQNREAICRSQDTSVDELSGRTVSKTTTTSSGAAENGVPPGTGCPLEHVSEYLVQDQSTATAAQSLTGQASVPSTLHAILPSPLSTQDRNSIQPSENDQPTSSTGSQPSSKLVLKILLANQTSSSLLVHAALAADMPDSDEDMKATVELEELHQRQMSAILSAFKNFRSTEITVAAPAKASSARRPPTSTYRPVPTSKRYIPRYEPPRPEQIFVPPISTIIDSKESPAAPTILSQIPSGDRRLIGNSLIEVSSSSFSEDFSRRVNTPLKIQHPQPTVQYSAAPAPGRTIQPKSIVQTNKPGTCTNPNVLVQARNAAKTRGIHVDESMGEQQVHDMIRAHDQRVHDSLALSRMSDSRPLTPRMPLAIPNGKAAYVDTPNSSLKARQMTPTTVMTPFASIPDSPYQAGRLPSNGLMALAPAPIATSLPVTPQRHAVKDSAPRANGFVAINKQQNGLRLAKIETPDEPPAGARLIPRSSSKPLASQSSRFRIDFRGLNGEKPGGGTIINVKENQEAVKERRKSKPASNDGSSGRASPVQTSAQFKRGGLVMSFRQD